MEIVSVFCFGDDIRHLDPAVFEMLMRYVVGTELAETKQFSPFPRFGMDRSPVVRSFLLQQLINSRWVFPELLFTIVNSLLISNCACCLLRAQLYNRGYD